MRVLILGDAAGNSGPSNVHREFINHWPEEDQIDYVRANNKIGFIREGVTKGMKCDVILSPLVNFPCIAAQDILHVLGKPIVSFNHGYVPYENEINGIGHSQWWIRRYVAALRSANVVVANSMFQKNFILRFQPELVGRIQSVALGIDHFSQRITNDRGIRPTVVVSGGTRKVKGNDVVARAASLLLERGTDLSLRVYGRKYDDGGFLANALPDDIGEECMLGHVDHEVFLKSLNESRLFVMNSRHDSFGMSIFDALKEGCSVLISRECGALEALEVESCDVVEDCEDVQEVAHKMSYLLEHPNAERLYRSIDFAKYSWDNQTARLREICADCCLQAQG